MCKSLIIILIILSIPVFGQSDDIVDEEILLYQLLKISVNTPDNQTIDKVKKVANQVRYIVNNQDSIDFSNELLLNEKNARIYRFTTMGPGIMTDKYYALLNETEYFDVPDVLDFINNISYKITLPDTTKLLLFEKIYNTIIFDKANVKFYLNYDKKIFGHPLKYEFFNKFEYFERHGKKQLQIIRVYELKWEDVVDKYQIAYNLIDNDEFEIKEILISRQPIE